MQNSISLLAPREEALILADAAANLLKPQSPGLLTLRGADLYIKASHCNHLALFGTSFWVCCKSSLISGQRAQEDSHVSRSHYVVFHLARCRWEEFRVGSESCQEWRPAAGALAKGLGSASFSQTDQRRPDTQIYTVRWRGWQLRVCCSSTHAHSLWPVWQVLVSQRGIRHVWLKSRHFIYTNTERTWPHTRTHTSVEMCSKQ